MSTAGVGRGWNKNVVRVFRPVNKRTWRFALHDYFIHLCHGVCPAHAGWHLSEILPTSRQRRTLNDYICYYDTVSPVQPSLFDLAVDERSSPKDSTELVGFFILSPDPCLLSSVFCLKFSPQHAEAPPNTEGERIIPCFLVGLFY